MDPSSPGEFEEGGRKALFRGLAVFPIGSVLDRAPEGGGGPPELSFPLLLLLLAAGLAVLLAVATQVRALRRRRDSSLATLAGGWPGPAATLDAEERFLSANQSFLETFGVKEEELRGKHLLEVLGPESQEALRPRVVEALEGKVAVTPEGFTPSSPSGRSFGATLIPRQGPHGVVDGFHALLCGAGAEGRPAVPVINGAGGRGDDQTVAERDAFLSRIAHDLRTPLQSIVGWTGLVRTGKLSGSESARALEVIESNARTLARLIDEILDHSLVVRGQLRLESRKLDLVPLVRETIDSLRQAADSKGVALETSASLATVPAVGDPDRLQQVVHILVLNAIKFTPRGGKVQVSARSSPGQSCLTVEDSGPGLPPEVIPDLFTSPLLRSPRDGRGLGLGLVTARYLVELHGGSIRAGNREEGSGAVMTVCLPAKEPAQVSAPEPWAPVFESNRAYAGDSRAATGESRILKGLRVLAVDDDEDTRKLLEVVLRKYGAQVKSVASAAEALKEVTAETGPRPDVLICDIAMPEESGYDLIHKVRMLKPERGGKIPAIALTGYSSGVDRMRALAAGFQNHVAKPIEPRELSMVIASIAHRGP